MVVTVAGINKEVNGALNNAPLSIVVIPFGNEIVESLVLYKQLVLRVLIVDGNEILVKSVSIKQPSDNS